MKELEIKLTVEEAELIMTALVTLPYKQVVQLVMKFDTQVRSQIQEMPNG